MTLEDLVIKFGRYYFLQRQIEYLSDVKTNKPDQWSAIDDFTLQDFEKEFDVLSKLELTNG
jgi:hypothetical protein